MLAIIALQLAALALLPLVIHVNHRRTARKVSRDYRAMGYADFSPAWTGEDGRRWRWDVTTGRIVAA